MIPRSTVDVEVNIDRQQLRSIDAQTVASGLACLHEYEPGIYPCASWEQAAGIIRAETDALIRLDASAANEEAFDDAAFDVERDLILGLELGVAGASEALCAAGCPTFASCRGHGDGPGVRSPFPWLLFAADEMRAPLLEEAARDAGCGLSLDENGLVEARAPSAAEMVKFGAALLARRREFDAIPQPFPRPSADA
jgi:hypothetical protein